MTSASPNSRLPPSGVDYSHFSLAPSERPPQPNATRRRSSDSRSSSLPPPTIARPPRRRTQELLGATIYGDQCEVGAGDSAGPDATRAGPSQAESLFGIKNPATDHPLSAEETSDILERVKRDVGGQDLNLRKMKGSLKRAFAGTEANSEREAGRAATVSPQEAFLDYDEVDKSLNNAGLDSNSSLFAPLPHQLNHNNLSLPLTHGHSHLHPRTPPHTFEGSHASSPALFSPPATANSFAVPENAVSWMSKSSKSGSGQSDEGSADDEGVTTPEPDDDRKSLRAFRHDRKDLHYRSHSPSYWPGPPKDDTIKPVPCELHRARRASESFPPVIQQQQTTLDLVDFASPDTPLPSPLLEAYYQNPYSSQTSAKLAQHFSGARKPKRPATALNSDEDYDSTSDPAVTAAALPAVPALAAAASRPRTVSSASSSLHKKVKLASTSPPPQELKPLATESELERAEEDDQLGSEYEDPSMSHHRHLTNSSAGTSSGNKEGKGPRKRRPSAPPLPPLPGQPQLSPPPAGSLKCPLLTETGLPCGVMFRRPYDLARHRETVHGEGAGAGKVAKSWKCDECKGVFSRKDALIRHARIVGHRTGLSGVIVGGPQPAQQVRHQPVPVLVGGGLVGYGGDVQ